MGQTKLELEGKDGESKAAIPTFAVRFESQDDFLVEYTDNLRHGKLGLPVSESLEPSQKVRLRVSLPDGAVLYLTGHIDGGSTDPSTGSVRLDALSDAQRTALDQCVEALVAPAGAEADEHRLGSGPISTAEPKSITILVVDDSVSQRIELGDELRARGMRVRVAENGLLALSAALKRPPDIILTDVEMPQMDGWTLLRSVRRRKRLLHVPVVFLTRLSDEMSRLRGYRMGADDFLPKDMKPEEIIARLDGALTRRRQLPPVTDAHGLRGDLEHVRLGSLLAFLESERRSGALNLRNGSDNAKLLLRHGALANVENLGRYEHPHDRVFELLDWNFGQFEFHAEAEDTSGPLPANDAQSTAVSYLLMEHARRQDESSAT